MLFFIKKLHRMDFCPKALTKLEERHGKNYLVDEY